jgi:RHS repeat-associated protein
MKSEFAQVFVKHRREASVSSIPDRDGFPGKVLIGLIVFLLFAIISQKVTQAQSLLGAGSPAYTTADPLPGGIGFINVANGNAHIEIAIGTSYPQRGGSPYAAKVVYDSLQWTPALGQWDGFFGGIQGGWSFLTTKDTGFVDATMNATSCSNGTTDTYSEIDWFAPDNTDHQFIVNLTVDHGCGAQNILTSSSYALDASGLLMNVQITPGNSFLTDLATVTVIARDGTTLVPLSNGQLTINSIPSVGTVKDSNGNFAIGNTLLAGTTPTDTLGRQPVTMSRAPNPEFIPRFDPFSSFGILNSSNTYSNVQATWTFINVKTNFGVSGVGEANFDIAVLQSLVLPDGTSYQFAYDCDSSAGNPACNSPGGQGGYYGLLTSVTLPTGGVINLGYSTYTDPNGSINRWVTSRSATGEGTFTYAPATGCGTGCETVTVTKPSGDQRVYTFSESLGVGAWNTQVKSYSGSASNGTLLMTVANAFQNFTTPSIFGLPAYTLPTSTTVTVPMAGGGSLIKQTSYTYDSYNYTYGGSNFTGSTGKLLSMTETAYGSGSVGSPVRKTNFSYLDDANSAYKALNIIDCPTDIQVQDGNGKTLSETKVAYDSTSLSAVSGIVGHDDTNYSAAKTLRGNATQISEMVTPGNFLQMLVQYDSTGQLLKVTDSLGNIISLGYADNFFFDSNPPQNPPPVFSAPGPTNAYLTSVTLPLSETTSLGYYYGTGKTASSIDPNGADSYLHYLDPLDRLTHTFLPITNGNRGWTLQSYSGSETQIDGFASITDSVASSNCISCSHRRSSLDSLDRPVQSVLVSDPDGVTTVATTYDSTGRVASVTNPYRSTGDPTYGISAPTYDGLDRPTQVQEPDNSIVQAFYGANVVSGGGIASQACSSGALGYPVLGVDETGRKNQVWIDGLGRTVETDQPDANGNLTVPSCYSYDPLDDLTSVSQGGQTRTYTYDSLSRLTLETTPESGTAFAFYTASSGSLCSGDSGEVCRVIDGRGITTTFVYDALDRLTSKTFSNGDPAITYNYDQASFSCLTITNGKGRRTSMTDGSGTTAWSYDANGDVLTELRQVGTVSESTSYSYNLDGSVASVTYPSDRTVIYGYSNAQRPISAADVVNGINYATSATYSPAGELASVILGKTSGFGGITQTYGFNNRLEATSVNASSSTGSVLNLAYNYFQLSGNNGNVASIANALDSTRSQAFTYDPLDRLLTGQTQSSTGSNCWGFNFGPDIIGNLLYETVSKCSAPSLSVSLDGNNHITNAGFSYDAAGNMTADSSYSYTYDGEGRLGTAAGVTYTYDGDDLRVSKSSGTSYWRDLDGDALAESNSSGAMVNEYVFFAGQRVARLQVNTPPTQNAIYYYFDDLLGSTRVITDSSGNLCYEADYYPYGGEITPAGFSNTCPQNYKFTGYERDAETGLDYAVARYYDSRVGRFTSVDPLDGAPEDTQSWNAYDYVENNPENAVDPSGMDPIFVQFSALDSGFDNGGLGWGSFDSLGFAGGTDWFPEAAIQDFVLGWTPSGYNPCAHSDCTARSVSPAFSPPSSGWFSHPIGAPGFWTGLIPIYGSARSAINDFQTGHWGWGLVQTGLAVSDVFLVKSLVTAVGKVAVKGAVVIAAKVAAREAAQEAIQKSAQAAVKEGIYEFTAASGKTYVGQSGDIGARITQHLASGKLLPRDLTSLRFSEVLGGRTAREIAEQLRINELGGIEGLENIRNPIGLARQHLLRIP